MGSRSQGIANPSPTLKEGSVRRVLQKPVQARGHGMLVKFDVTDLTKVARHDREGSYEGND